MPPASLAVPSAAMSVLKSFLSYNNYKTEIVYWNFKFTKLQCSFLWTDDPNVLSDEGNSLLLFFNYIAIKSNDMESYNSIKAKLMSIKPHYINEDVTKFDRHMNRHAKELDRLIDKELAIVCNAETLCYGMSASMYQWVCASIIAQKIKEKHQKAYIVLGGIGTKNSALKFIENFDQFDFAIWGEGEVPLKYLCQSLTSPVKNYSDIPHLVYRENNQIKVSEKKSTEYSDLSRPYSKPDYADYFSQKKAHPHLANIKSVIGLEASRSCHWKRCHFCYLNTGYRYRIKPVKNITKEILYYIKRHKIYDFNFLDNDLISNDFKRYDELLNGLIAIKDEFPDFSIHMAEIITKGVSALILKKMLLAGFSHIQIGYESLSNNLLKKIDKKNTFASNFLVIKFSCLYNISINGANIIMGLMEETGDDIIESIENLAYLRFVLDKNGFRHQHTSLGVMHSSPYFKKMQNEKVTWMKNYHFDRFLARNYMKYMDDNADIIEYIKQNNSPLWKDFRTVEHHYLQNSYRYQLIKTEEGILYKEFINLLTIKELILDDLDCYILLLTNEVVLSVDSLLKSIRNYFGDNLLDLEIMNTLENLKTERLIYISDDYKEVVSVININLAI